MKIFRHPSHPASILMLTNVYGKVGEPRRVILYPRDIESFSDTSLKGDIKGTTIIGTSGHVYVVEETIDDIMELLGWDLK